MRKYVPFAEVSINAIRGPVEDLLRTAQKEERSKAFTDASKIATALATDTYKTAPEHAVCMQISLALSFEAAKARK
jgi:hypothetical protein